MPLEYVPSENAGLIFRETKPFSTPRLYMSTPGSAGIDVRFPVERRIYSGKRYYVDTCLQIVKNTRKVPSLVWDRSGVNLKNHIEVFQGLIDGDYLNQPIVIAMYRHPHCSNFETIAVHEGGEVLTGGDGSNRSRGVAGKLAADGQEFVSHVPAWNTWTRFAQLLFLTEREVTFTLLNSNGVPYPREDVCGFVTRTGGFGSTGDS